MEPDRRFAPVCHHCGKKAAAVHSWTGRSVRDLDMAGTRVWLDCRYRKIYCAGCRRIVIAYSDAIRHLIPIDSATPFRRKPPPDSDRFRHP